MANDIALIKITAVQYSSGISPIRLPSMQPPYASYVDEKAVATGWGRTSDSDQYNSDDLMYAYMEVISNAACTKTYGASIESSNICVSTTSGASTCGGDDGGPLALDSKIPTLIGIASFGSQKGCEKGLPVAFTRVTNYLDWIQAETGVAY
ncbi:serine protease 1-like [Drosophila grimshawi]|nr:serine protease 1-like [Drosophila grimshawi]